MPCCSVGWKGDGQSDPPVGPQGARMGTGTGGRGRVLLSRKGTLLKGPNRQHNGQMSKNI